MYTMYYIITLLFLFGMVNSYVYNIDHQLDTQSYLTYRIEPGHRIINFNFVVSNGVVNILILDKNNYSIYTENKEKFVSFTSNNIHRYFYHNNVNNLNLQTTLIVYSDVSYIVIEPTNYFYMIRIYGYIDVYDETYSLIKTYLDGIYLIFLKVCVVLVFASLFIFLCFDALLGCFPIQTYLKIKLIYKFCCKKKNN